MSSTYGSVERYSCFNDCRQTGCPGHTVQTRYYGVADVIEVYVDGQHADTFDPSMFKALLRSWERDGTGVVPEQIRKEREGR